MKIFRQLEKVVNDYITQIKTIFELFTLEAQLAYLSVFPLLVSVFFLALVFATIWFSGMGLIGCLLFWIFGNLWIALGSVFAISCLLFIWIALYVRFNLRQMTFEKTRHYFFHKKETANEYIEKKSPT